MGRARRDLVGAREQDMHMMGVGETAWEYMRGLMKDIDLPAYDEWSRRLGVVHEIYMDRVRRAPKRPWEEDRYRRVNYNVNWEAGQWEADEAR